MVLDRPPALPRPHPHCSNTRCVTCHRAALLADYRYLRGNHDRHRRNAARFRPLGGGGETEARLALKPACGDPVLRLPRGGILYMAYSVYVDVDAAGVRTATYLPFILLFVALLIALGFEFVNGFHDTANAVA